jgi:hypothetical protein
VVGLWKRQPAGPNPSWGKKHGIHCESCCPSVTLSLRPPLWLLWSLCMARRNVTGVSLLHSSSVKTVDMVGASKRPGLLPRSYAPPGVGRHTPSTNFVPFASCPLGLSRCPNSLESNIWLWEPCSQQIPNLEVMGPQSRIMP